MKRTLIILAVVVGVLVIAGLGMYFKMSRDAQAGLASLVYEPVDMMRVADGAYTGEADAGLVTVKVEVDVRDHVLREVRLLEHKNGMGGAAEAITGAMVAANTYDVDAISGATLSSQTIKSAVSKALKQGEN